MKNNILKIGLALLTVIVTISLVESGSDRGWRRRQKKSGSCLPGGNIQCGPFTDCVSRNRNICQCKDGYSGDPYSATGCVCKQHLCGVNAYCEGRGCKCNPGAVGNPYTMCLLGTCGNQHCGANAHCEQDICVCDEGSTGNPSTGCEATCGSGTCGLNAHCDSAGSCVCNSGYFGDPVKGCGGPCDGRFCGANASCVNNFCRCNALHQGNAWYPYGCSVPDRRVCGDRICGWNAKCVNGQCECISTLYVGDPYIECKSTSNCGSAPCGPHSYCVENYSFCACDSGYSRDSTTGQCVNGCYGVECGPTYFCSVIDNMCICRYHYKLDPVTFTCVPAKCGGIYCGPLAECKSGTCQCYTGYFGDPTVGCSKPLLA